MFVLPTKTLALLGLSVLLIQSLAFGGEAHATAILFERNLARTGPSLSEGDFSSTQTTNQRIPMYGTGFSSTRTSTAPESTTSPTTSLGGGSFSGQRTWRGSGTTFGGLATPTPTYSWTLAGNPPPGDAGSAPTPSNVGNTAGSNLRETRRLLRLQRQFAQTATQPVQTIIDPGPVAQTQTAETSTVPEPGVAFLLLMGLAGIAGLRVRRQGFIKADI